jgi:hypothetical protein
LKIEAADRAALDEQRAASALENKAILEQERRRDAADQQALAGIRKQLALEKKDQLEQERKGMVAEQRQKRLEDAASRKEALESRERVIGRMEVDELRERMIEKADRAALAEQKELDEMYNKTPGRGRTGHRGADGGAWRIKKQADLERAGRLEQERQQEFARRRQEKEKRLADVESG